MVQGLSLEVKSHFSMVQFFEIFIVISSIRLCAQKPKIRNTLLFPNDFLYNRRAKDDIVWAKESHFLFKNQVTSVAQFSWFDYRLVLFTLLFVV